MPIFLDNETKKQITQCIQLLKEILGTDLLGMYLYGSAMVGGLQKYSDIDLFVVSDRSTTYKEKIKLAANMLDISGKYQKGLKRPIELTVIEKTAINPWSYPPHFDFQYGDWLRKEFESGIIEPWASKEMPDIALLVTQVLLACQTLVGLPPEQLLCNVPYGDFILATTRILDDLMANLSHDTRNVLLTYARIWSTLETDAIYSKPSAASWVIARLPELYQPVLKRARSICIGEEEENWDDIQPFIKPCVNFILTHINKKLSLLETIDHSHHTLKLAE